MRVYVNVVASLILGLNSADRAFVEIIIIMIIIDIKKITVTEIVVTLRFRLVCPGLHQVTKSQRMKPTTN